MIIRWCAGIFLSSWMWLGYAKSTEFVRIDTANQSVRLPVKSWKTLRDQGVVKQDTDNSCGAASIATILNEFYGQQITEQQILDSIAVEKQRVNFKTFIDVLTLLRNQDVKKFDSFITQVRRPIELLWEYSFEDLVKVLNQFGFKAYGIAASYEQLTKLNIPVIIYMKFRKDDHFSVLRGINRNTVWLADPSLGNRTYSKQQFLSHWNTRSNTALNGKALVILPNTQQTNQITQLNIHPNYFTKNPVRQTESTLNIMQNLGVIIY